MKNLFFLPFFLLPLLLHAQVGPPGGPTNGRIFSYDAAGNRVLRSQQQGGPSTLRLAAPETQLVVAPNPSDGRFVLSLLREGESLSPEGAVIEVLDLQGRLVSHHAPRGLPIKLDLRHLPSGSYFLRLHTQGEVYAQRVEKRD